MEAQGGVNFYILEPLVTRVASFQFKADQKSQQEIPPRPHKRSKTMTGSAVHPEFLFQIHLQETRYYGLQMTNGWRVIRVNNKSAPDIKTFSSDPFTFKYSAELKHKVAIMLNHIGLQNKEQEEEYSKLIAERAFDMANSVENMGHPVLTLGVDLSLQKSYAIRLFRIQESGENGSGMVPASLVAIQDLERIQFNGGNDNNTTTQCVICMDKLEKGSDVTRMPCSHVFHENCIVPWLKKSHMCPICRFKMPVEEH